MNRCDGCKHYRPIREKYDAGVMIGECHPGPPAFRGTPHNGTQFLGVWVHVRAHWECSQFDAGTGQPDAPTDEDESEGSGGVSGVSGLSGVGPRPSGTAALGDPTPPTPPTPPTGPPADRAAANQNQTQKKRIGGRS